jgi:hypothetical protein
VCLHARLLDVVPGRSARAYADWLHAQTEAFVAGIEHAAGALVSRGSRRRPTLGLAPSLSHVGWREHLRIEWVQACRGTSVSAVGVDAAQEAESRTLIRGAQRPLGVPLVQGVNGPNEWFDSRCIQRPATSDLE